ncbi:hypothetical protein ABIC03_006229 [Bradyrhizobium sp. RT6a]
MVSRRFREGAKSHITETIGLAGLTAYGSLS